MPQLSHLQTFLAVYRTSSLTRAAAQLHMSQPGVSAHLRVLEAELGRPLFVRLARGVAPTPGADALAGDVALHLDALEGVQQRLRGGLEDAIVHLGGPADMLASRALAALAGLSDQRVRIRARTGIAETLLAALATDELDMVIATRQVRDRRLSYEPLFAERLVLIAGPVWARRLDVAAVKRDPAVLDDVPLVAFDEALPILRQYWADVFELELRRPAAVTVPDLRGVCSVVRAGGGISVVPRYLVAESLRSGELMQIHQPKRPPTTPIFLAYRTPGLQRPGVQAVRHALLRAAAGFDLGL